VSQPIQVPKTLLAWSSGKDSAWSLHVLRQRGTPPAALLTTVNQAAGRVAMHGVRQELLEAQAAAVGLPLWQVPLPWPCTNADYEAAMGDVCRRAVAAGFDTMAFGDLFLEDIRAYRVRQLAGTGLEPIFPLWQLPTAALAREMIAAGLRARLASLDLSRLDRSFAGRDFDTALLDAFPPGVDPCGENGEFHSFVYDSPEFARPIPVRCGETRESGGFLHIDLHPAAL
jgi:uncharacterized protein (TIGR00290 family)